MQEDELERIREENVSGIIRGIAGRIKETGKKARRRKIEESKYNEMYRRIMTEGTLEYLKGKMKKRDRSEG